MAFFQGTADQTPTTPHLGTPGDKVFAVAEALLRGKIRPMLQVAFDTVTHDLRVAKLSLAT